MVEIMVDRDVVKQAMVEIMVDRDVLAQAAGLFNRKHYFECHEVLEDAWMESLGDEKQFLQGLIHIAVGLYHAAAENYKGASNQLEKGIRRLTPSLPARDGLDVAGLVGPSRNALEKVRRGLQGEKVLWNENDVPAMKFRD
jgi:hypothetical protein